MNILSNINDLNNKIDLNKAKIEFLMSHGIHCPRHPKEYTMNDVDKLISNICRYSKRTLYYANKFIDSLYSVLTELEISDKNKLPVMTTIKDDIFFEFDAFVFSLKSLTEENIVNNAKKLDKESLKAFKIFSSLHFNNFVKPFLIPIRNEVTHLNNFGTAIGSLISISKEQKVSIRCNYKNIDGKDLDLIQIFNLFIEKTFDLIDNLLGIFIHHNFVRWGIPDNDIYYCNYNLKVNHKDFRIPNFDGINIKS